jgi:hypothetical protein
LMQLLSQQREFLRHSSDAYRAIGCRFFRSVVAQSGSPFLLLGLFSARPLGSIRVTGLPRYYGPLRLPARAAAVICSRRRLLCVATPLPCRVPGSSTDLSLRAAPSHPGKPGDCVYPLLHRRFQASPHLAGWPLPLRNEAETVLLALRLTGLLFGASSQRIAPPHARLATCRMGYLHGEFLSSHKISQASPGAPVLH